jgi:predicted RNase H-like nuclease (RuvC/YqgF family)
METNRSMSEELEANRKYRECHEENKRLKLKISELESDNKMLEKELALRNCL